MMQTIRTIALAIPPLSDEEIGRAKLVLQRAAMRPKQR